MVWWSWAVILDPPPPNSSDWQNAINKSTDGGSLDQFSARISGTLRAQTEAEVKRSRRGAGQEKDSLLIWLQLPGHQVSSKSSLRVPDGAIKGPQVPVEEGGLVGWAAFHIANRLTS